LTKSPENILQKPYPTFTSSES